MMPSFQVLGVPAPQGSKRAFVVGGKARMTDMGGKGAVAWRDSVAAAAEAEAKYAGCLDGPLFLSVTFRFPMPAARKKADRQRGWCYKTTAPDSSKLLRCLEDGLQAGGLIHDDARIVHHEVTKIEVHDASTGAIVTIEPMAGPV